MTVIPRRSVRTAITAATAAFTLLGGAAFGQVDNTTLVPADSAYVFHMPKSAQMWNAWKDNAIYQSFRKLMEEPDFKEKTEGFGREVKTIEDALGFKLDGETLSAIFANATAYVGPGENAAETKTGLIAAISDKDRFNKILDLAEKAAVSAAAQDEKPADEDKPASETEKPAADEKTGGPDDDDATTAASPITSETYEGVTFKRFAADEDSEFFYGVSGDLLVAAGSRSEIKALIDRSKGKAAGDVLSADADYKKTSASLASHPGELYLFQDTKASMEMQQGQPGMDQFRDLLRKIAPVDFTATSVKIEPLKILTYSYAPISTGDMAELIKKNPGTTPLEVVKFAPKDSLLVFGTSLLAPELYYTLVKEALGAAGTDTAAFDQQMEALEQTLGFSVKSDLLPALGNELAFIIASFQMSGTMPAVEGAAAFKIANKEKMAKVTAGIDKLAAQMGGGTDDGGGLKSTKIGEATAKTMEIPGQTSYSPGYVVTGNYLVLGSSLKALQNAVAAKTDEAKSLTANATYKRLAPAVSIEGNAFQFFNFQGLWDTVRAFTAFAGENAEQAAKIVDALKVINAWGGSSSVQDDALVSQGAVLLGKPASGEAAAE